MTKNDSAFKKKHIFFITLVYVLAHWFLLVATGKWWDDWCYADKDWGVLLEAFKQSSLPLHAYIDAFLWFFPDGFDRVLTFVYFYIGTIIFYKILNAIDLFSIEDAFWIALIYCVVPINDARISWICYGYSFGLLMFWIAFYLCVLWKNSKGKKAIILRVLSLLVLLISYDTESIMMLTFVILAYFVYEDLKLVLNKEKRWLKFVVVECIKYMDYIIAPIVFYVGTKVLFPGYGFFNKHSYIPWGDILEIVLVSPKKAFWCLMWILKSYLIVAQSSNVIIVLLLIIGAIYVTFNLKNKKLEKQNKTREEKRRIKYPYRDIIFILLGSMCVFWGSFPYLVRIRANHAFSNMYIEGRFSLLLGIGASIFIYYIIDLFFNKLLHGIIAHVFIICFVILGTIHFNYMYMDWQESYYQQVQLQHEIETNDFIKDNDTFIVLYNGPMMFAHYEQTNGNAWFVTGEQTRFFLTGQRDIGKLINLEKEEPICIDLSLMKEYKYQKKPVIDGIIFVNYEELDRKVIIEQKYNELFRKEEFNSWIDGIKDIKCVSISVEESDELIKMYSEYELTDEILYNRFYDND